MWRSFRRVWNPARSKPVMVLRRGWLAAAIMQSVLLVTLGACSSGGKSTPVPRAGTQTFLPINTATVEPVTHVPPPPITTRTATIPPSVHTLALNMPLETVYVPGMWELYAFTVDDALRMGLTISALDTESELALYAQVVAADGTPISQVAMFDDPLLSGVWDLPGPGDYTLQLYGPETRPRRVVLTLSTLFTPQPGGGEIAYGQTRSGAIQVADQRDIWTFEGAAGERVGISMFTDGDGILAVQGPDGTIIAQNDDSAHLGQSPALDFVLPTSGVYTVEVRFYGGTTGTYRLAVQHLD